MEHLMACTFAEYLCKQQIIKRDYYEVYVYGTELVLSFIFTTTIVLILGMIIGELIGSLIFLLVFILLRRFTGGYHASTHLKCKLVTISVFLISIGASVLIHASWWMYLLLFVVGNTVIWFLAPIENPNKPLNEREKKKYHWLSHIVFTVLSITGLVLSFLIQSTISILWFSMLAVIVLMIIPKLKKGVTEQ